MAMCPQCDGALARIEIPLTGRQLTMAYCTPCDLHTWRDGNRPVTGHQVVEAIRTELPPTRQACARDRARALAGAGR